MKKILYSFVGFFLITLSASSQSELKSLTEQLKGIKEGDEYKIFEMSGNGLVAKPPAKPKGLRDAFSPNIIVQTAKYTSDSIDANGNPHIVELIFTREGGDFEGSIDKTGGLVPITTKGKDAIKSDRFVVVVDGDIYFVKGLNYNGTSGSSSIQIQQIISKKKLAGIKGDPKSEAMYQEKVTGYLAAMATESNKIIAAAIEKRRKENSLEGRKVTSIELIMEKESVTPGEKTKIGVVAKLKDGSELKTLGFAKGGTFWNDYKITVTGGSFDNGNLTTSEDFSNSNKDQVSFTIESVYIPSLKISKTVNISYARTYDFSYTQDGMYGTFGSTGTKGNCIKGKVAGDGKNGSNGGNGTSAGEINLKITPYNHAQTKEALLKYELTTSSGTKQFVTASTSVVSINANGGNGGNGGSGGNGGDVSSEHSAGEPDKCDCASSVSYMGRGGNGGSGGNGGNGGNVTVTVDPAITLYTLKVSTEPGFGGNGGSAGTPDMATSCQNNKAVQSAKEAKKGKPGSNGKQGLKGNLITKKG